MQDRIAQRLAQLQQEQAQTQQALAALEQQRQGILQELIGMTYAAQVLEGLLQDPAPALPPYDPAENGGIQFRAPVAP